MKMTSADLAKMCGVSRATVDRVFNGRGYVSAETRKKILDAAQETGYRPDYLARSLVTGSTRSIGIVLPGLNNSFFSTLLNAVTRKAQERDFITLVSLYEDRADYEYRCVSGLVDRRVDGLILFSTSKGSEPAKMLVERQIRAVAILNEAGGLPCVSIDYDRAMFDAANYVISKGYESLVFLCPPLSYEADSNIFAIRQRLRGFERALGQQAMKGVAGRIIGTNDYLAQLADMQFPCVRKTAILCSSDIYALQTLRLLKTRGVRVPYDVGIMGFDGIDMLDYVEPSIATVAIPIAGLGETAAESVLYAIANNQTALPALLPYCIRAGQSIV